MSDRRRVSQRWSPFPGHSPLSSSHVTIVKSSYFAGSLDIKIKRMSGAPERYMYLTEYWPMLWWCEGSGPTYNYLTQTAAGLAGTGRGLPRIEESASLQIDPQPQRKLWTGSSGWFSFMTCCLHLMLIILVSTISLLFTLIYVLHERTEISWRFTPKSKTDQKDVSVKMSGTKDQI